MPPAPISRSSTYLPKIWGNIAFAALGLPALGCGPETPEDVTRTVRVYSLPGCPAPESATLELEALGPFPVTNSTAEDLTIGGAGRELRFPAETRAITAAAEDSGGRFIGYGEAFESGDVEIVLWPEGEACTVFDRAELAGFPSRGGGQALGYAPSSGLLLAAGGNDPTSSAVVGALTFDVRSGSAYAVDASARHVMGEPRAFATVSEFGDKLLVAGGENPIHDVHPPRDTAEVYNPVARRFELELLELREPRTRHAALVLPSSGETLLIGGRGAFDSALATLEVVTPATRSSSVGIQPLAFGRIEPVALRLSDGRIFVGGGYDSDGQPVTALEWLEPNGDGASMAPLEPLPPLLAERAFVAMPGGAVLAVGVCPASAQPDECSPAWWIDPQGSAEAVELPDAASDWLLLPGSDGSPWLFTGAETLRFNPFRARFEEARSAPAAQPPPGLAPPIAAAPDHFFWINDADPPALIGVRAGTRDRYARDVALLSPQLPDPLWPLHLSPDRHPQGRLRFDTALHFDGSAISVFVTDALYDDVDISLDVEGTPPWIVIGGTTLGGEDCRWPVEDSSRQTLELRRAGGSAVLKSGAASRSCPVTPGPAAVALSSPEEESHVYALEVQRR